MNCTDFSLISEALAHDINLEGATFHYSPDSRSFVVYVSVPLPWEWDSLFRRSRYKGAIEEAIGTGEKVWCSLSKISPRLSCLVETASVELVKDTFHPAMSALDVRLGFSSETVSDDLLRKKSDLVAMVAGPVYRHLSGECETILDLYSEASECLSLVSLDACTSEQGVDELLLMGRNDPHSLLLEVISWG